MMTTRSIHSKLRKTSSEISLADIPNSLLVEVAKFLSEPSAALFAVALSAPSASWLNVQNRGASEISAAIVSALNNNWDEIDFVEDIDLAKKLSDDDVGALLVCIDAENKVKRLKLTGCVNITGRGLEPLRGSVVLEQIDLRA